MLTLTNLYTGYGKRIIGHRLSAHIPQGKLVALLGPNGAGKSTLLRTLAGLQPPAKVPEAEESGGIRLDGKCLADYTPRQLARKLSVVLTFKPSADALTAQDVVETGRIPYNSLLSRFSSTDRHAVSRAMEMTGCADLAHRTVSTLSDGERQRVFIAKALAQQTPVILLDEPTAFLDFPSKVSLLQLLRSLAHEEGKAILLSTHDVELALQFADLLWLLAPDSITCGTPSGLADSGELGSFFDSPGLSFSPSALRFVCHPAP